jgi:hypothetical protein
MHRLIESSNVKQNGHSSTMLWPFKQTICGQLTAVISQRDCRVEATLWTRSMPFPGRDAVCDPTCRFSKPCATHLTAVMMKLMTRRRPRRTSA